MKIEYKYDLTHLEQIYPEIVPAFHKEIEDIIEQLKNSNYPLETIIAGLLINDEINLQPIYDKKETYIKNKAIEYLHNILIDLDSAHDENTKYNPYSLF